MQLQIFINVNFPNQREFVKAFNAAGGMLTEQQLSRHLNGRRGLSKGWQSAYSLYFGGRVTPEDILKEKGHTSEEELKDGYVRIEGVDNATGFERTCAEQDLAKVAEEIFNEHPGEHGYYNFTKYLWVHYPDDRPERRLHDVVM